MVNVMGIARFLVLVRRTRTPKTTLSACRRVCVTKAALAEEHRRLRDATAASTAVAAGGQQGGAAVPWGRGVGGASASGGSKPAMSLLEIQQQEAKLHDQQGVGEKTLPKVVLV